MSTLHEPSQNLRPLIPVVLAGGTNLDRWPRSRVNMPIQFQPDASRRSMFEKILAGVAELHHSLPPIITLPSSALAVGHQQLSDIPLLQDCPIIVEPVDRGCLNALLVAAIHASKTDASALLMIIDCSNPPSDWQAMVRIVDDMRESPLLEDHIVACAERVPASQHGMRSVCRGAPTEDPKLFYAAPFDPKSEKSVFKFGSVTFSVVEKMIETTREFSPESVVACTKALALGDSVKNIVWPDLNVWSAQEVRNFPSTISQHHGDILVRPVGTENPTAAHTQSSNVIQIDAANCTVNADGHLVAIAGCKNLNVVATRDATLITASDTHVDMGPLISRLQAYERPEILDFPVVFRPWGQHTEIDRSHLYSVRRLEIEPGSEIPIHRHEYRAETWHVLAGRGRLQIGDEVKTFVTGESVDVARGVFHGCENLGPTPMVILETRHGAMINEMDCSINQGLKIGQEALSSA